MNREDLEYINFLAEKAKGWIDVDAEITKNWIRQIQDFTNERAMELETSTALKLSIKNILTK